MQIGSSLEDNCDDDHACGVTEALVAGALLATLVSVLDASVLSRLGRSKTTPQPQSPAAQTALLRYGSLRANPDVRIGIDGNVTLGLTGNF